MNRQHSTASIGSASRPLLSKVQRSDSKPRQNEEEDEEDYSSLVKFRRPQQPRHAHQSPQSVRIVSLMPTTTSSGVTRFVPVPVSGKFGSTERMSRLRKNSDQSLGSSQTRSRMHSEHESGNHRKAPAGQETVIRMSRTPSRDPDTSLRTSALSLDRSISKSTDIDHPSHPKHKGISRVQELNQKRRSCWAPFKSVYQRFGLKHFVLAIILVGYSLVGAALFQFLERSHEEAMYKKMHQEAAVRREQVLKHLIQKIRGVECMDRVEIMPESIKIGTGQSVRSKLSTDGQLSNQSPLTTLTVHLFIKPSDNSDQLPSNHSSVNIKPIQNRSEFNQQSIKTHRSLRSAINDQLPSKPATEPTDHSGSPDLATILNESNSTSSSCQASLRALLIAYEKELGVFEPGPKYEWDFWNSVFFAGTIFTTIGYGHMACRTPWGRLVTVLYALAGIPLMLAFLNGLGDVLFKKARLCWSRARRFYRLFMRTLRDQRKDGVSVKRSLSRAASSVSTAPDEPYGNFPLILAIGLVLGYVMGCAAIFCLWETNWDYWTAVYFFFVSLTTVGFGDIVPDHPRFTILGFIFFIIGLALVSMCINVIQAKMEKNYKYYFNWDEIQDMIVQSGEDSGGPVSLLFTPPTPSNMSMFSSAHKLPVVPEEAEENSIFTRQASLGIFQIVRYPQEPLQDSSSDTEMENIHEEIHPPSELSSTPPPEPDMKSVISTISDGPKYPAAFFDIAKSQKSGRSMIRPMSVDQSMIKPQSADLIKPASVDIDIDVQRTAGPHKFVSTHRTGSDEIQKSAEPQKSLTMRRPESLPLGTDYLTIPLTKSKKDLDKVELRQISDAQNRQLRVSFSPSVPSGDTE